MKKNLVLLSLPLLCLCSCNNAQESKKVESSNIEISSNQEASSKEEDGPINVFVLAGQSNMEGNTQFDDGDGKHYLQDAFDEMDIDESVEDLKEVGIPEVQTSYYIGPAFNPSNRHGSNEEDNIAGKFLPTVLGMGAGDVKDQFGPEVGAAYALREYASEDEPIYFVKAAYGGSSITSNWNINSESGLYQSHLVKFLNNNLKLIEEETGKKPTVKGLLWHQGENDANSGSTYKANLSALVSKFREDFADYAPDEDGDNIAFIDCYIFDKGDSDSDRLPSNVNVGQMKVLNNAKKEFAEEGDMNFVVNSSWQYEGGLKLQVNENSSGVDHGGVGGQHYWAGDMFKLGMAYADIIIENDLLD